MIEDHIQQSLSIPSVDRPDIAKTQYKATLNFKEVKDCLFKFLMQAGIKFTGPERLSIGGFLHTKSETIDIEKGGISYKVSCKLEEVTVDNKPVYLVVIAGNYLDLQTRQKNALSKLREKFKIIIFEDKDFEAIHLDIVGKEWIKPLSRTVLKSWARCLFQRLVELGGSIKTGFTLNDLFETIDKNTSSQNSKQSIINFLNKENFNLKKALKIAAISKNFTLGSHYDSIVDSLVLSNKESLTWVESLVRDVVTKVNEIDLRKRSFKECFRLKTGEIAVVNKDKLTQYIISSMHYGNATFDITSLGYGLIQIQNKKTLQVVTLYIAPTTTDRLPEVSLPVEVVKNIRTTQVYSLILFFNKQSGKVSRVFGEVFLTGNYSTPFKYDKIHRLPVFDSSLQDEYTLIDF